MQIWNPEKYTQAWDFACHAHRGQQVPGQDIPYIHHVATVAMEAMTALTITALARNQGMQMPGIERPDLLIQSALLHDVIEDTDCRFEDIKNQFGLEVAQGVLALSKDPKLPTKREQMADSLARIKQQPPEIWMVKLADRITNLQAPPSYWSLEKIKAYQEEARSILTELGQANGYLADRLATKIAEYSRYVSLG